MSSREGSDMSPIERLALMAGQMANEKAMGKALQYRFLRTATYAWVQPAMSRRTFVDNADWLIPPPSDRGVVIACNHRTFFDAYVYMFVLFHLGASWPRNLYFPVRSDFFYDNPVGMAINFAVGAGVMYPPIYRDRSQRARNQEALDSLSSFLDRPFTLVGLHPEGTRNKNESPYDLLPAQPGIGQIVLHAKPLVVPLFINGMTNDFLRSIRNSFRPDAKRRNPLILSFGDPIDYSEFEGKKPRAALYKRCADKILDGVRACGEREKELRAKIVSGEIDESHPGWLYHG